MAASSRWGDRPSELAEGSALGRVAAGDTALGRVAAGDTPLVNLVTTRVGLLLIYYGAWMGLIALTVIFLCLAAISFGWTSVLGFVVPAVGGMIIGLFLGLLAGFVGHCVRLATPTEVGANRLVMMSFLMHILSFIVAILAAILAAVAPTPQLGNSIVVPVQIVSGPSNWSGSFAFSLSL